MFFSCACRVSYINNLGCCAVVYVTMVTVAVLLAIDGESILHTKAKICSKSSRGSRKYRLIRVAAWLTWWTIKYLWTI